MKLKNQILIYILILSALLIGLISTASFWQGLGKGLGVLYNIKNIEPSEKKLAESISEVGGEEVVQQEDTSPDDVTNNNRNLADTFSLLTNQRVTAYTIRPEEGTDCESASGVDLCKLGRDEPIFAVVNKELKLAEIMACPPEYDFETVVSFLEVNYRGEIYERYFRCLDRMNEYHRKMGHWDILMRGENPVQRANNYGVQYKNIMVYK